MKKVFLTLAVLSVVCFAGQTQALTVTRDGVLTEWVGVEINNLGTEPAPAGGTYTLLAAWDGAVLQLGIDRNSTNRYLGDTANVNDSFYMAIDVDGVDASGAASVGFNNSGTGQPGIMQWSGTRLPDILYYFEGGSGWYKVAYWTGSGWTEAWSSLPAWSNAGTFYGWQEATPNDELTSDLLARLTDCGKTLANTNELSVWAWMSPEANGDVVASWPSGYTGSSPVTIGAPVKIRSLAAISAMAHNPTPSVGQTGVTVSGLSLSWSVAQNLSGVVDPNLASHNLYISTDPNLASVTPISIAGWNTETLRASYTPSPVLNKDAYYYWRVDTVKNDASVVTGDVWTFYTELTVPIIMTNPAYQIVAAGAAANFSVVVQSPSTVLYQWYKYVDGISDIQLTNAGDISGAATDTLSIANAAMEDEGNYYCIVNNDSGVPATSGQAPLAIQRRLAFWDFESGNANSTVAGSPTSVIVGTPGFVTAGGPDGSDAMSFAAVDPNSQMLYTDPSAAAYFDICNINLTVACWVKSTSTVDWIPLVARNGEDSGWQLRQSGFTTNAGTTDRPCLTARGTTGNDNGTPANRTVYDGAWHYLVATYDGAIKKVYIDGVVSRFYSTDNGGVANDGDAVTGVITSSGSPIAIAGRVRGNPTSGLTVENFNTVGTFDKVEIYNYALDAATIAQTYADITDTAVCPGLQAYDLDGNCKVNLDDFVLLASQWLSDMSVQPTP